MMTASVMTWYDCTKRNFLKWMEAPFQDEHLLFKKRAPEKIRHDIGDLTASYLTSQAERLEKKPDPTKQILLNVADWERIDNDNATSLLKETSELFEYSLMQNTPEEARNCARIVTFFHKLQGPASARKLMCAGLIRALLRKDVTKKDLDDLFDKPTMLSKLAGETWVLLNTYRAEMLEKAAESVGDLGGTDWGMYKRNTLYPQTKSNEGDVTNFKQLLTFQLATLSIIFMPPAASTCVIAGATYMLAEGLVREGARTEDKDVFKVSGKERNQRGLRWAAHEVCATAALALPLIAAGLNVMQGNGIGLGLSCTTAFAAHMLGASDSPRRQPALDSMGLT